MEVLCIIPARGGSRRLPRKNLLPCGGKPLLVHSIEHSLGSRTVTRTVVSTDDADIAAVSREAGAEVLMRPPELAVDQATSESALEHVVDSLRDSEQYQPDLIVFLQCTSPVRAPDDIDKAIDHLLKTHADSLFSATESTWLLWRAQGVQVSSFNYDYRRRKREQDMTVEWRENGSIYVFRPQVLREHHNRLGGKIVLYRMDYWSSFQVDQPEDLELADWILRRRTHADRSKVLPDRIGAVVFDFDGVFTDNRVLVGEDGRESVSCNRGDGLGLDYLRATGLPLLVLSTERNAVVAARCEKLQLECRQGLRDKGAALKDFAAERDIPLSSIVYVGNDLNDRECLSAAGCGILVADAHPLVREFAAITLTRRGGEGAVREVCDLIVQHLARQQKTEGGQ
jgi:N-acylneuraminate cytidylyltransferase